MKFHILKSLSKISVESVGNIYGAKQLNQVANHDYK